MDNSPIEKLVSMGFSRKQAIVYLTLLELRELIPSSIARKTGLKRPTVYKVLEELMEKSFVTSLEKNKVLHFKAIPAQELSRMLKEKAEQEMANLNALEPQLTEVENRHGQLAVTPKMSVYYGIEGLIQIMEDSLTTNGEMLCWANGTEALGALSHYYPSYIKKKVARKIPLRGIFCDDKIGREFKARGKKELREVILLPREEMPLENEIIIYDDKIAILSHSEKIGMIIQSRSITNTQRAIFELAWKRKNSSTSKEI